MQSSTLRWAGAVGLVAIVLILISAFGSGQPPSIDDPANEIRDYLVDNRSALLFGVFLQLLVFPLVAWFVVTIRRVLAQGDDSVFPTVTLASIFVLGGLVQVAGATSGGLLLKDGFAETVSDDTLLFAWYATNLVYAVGATAMVAGLGSFGLSTLRGKVFPVWLGWLSVASAAVALVSFISVFDSEMADISLLGLLAFTVWIIATSITLLTMKGAGAHSAAPGTAPRP